MIADYELPKATIYITSYNQAGIVCRAIESALAQDYANFEVIISDNCSSDDTSERVKEYLSDPRVRYIKNETNVGMFMNFYNGPHRHATGEYFCWLCGDDYYVNKSFVSNSIKFMRARPKCELVVSNFAEVTESGDVISEFSAYKAIHKYLDSDVLVHGHDIIEVVVKKGVLFDLCFAGCCFKIDTVRKYFTKEIDTDAADLLLIFNILLGNCVLSAIDHDSCAHVSSPGNAGKFSSPEKHAKKIFVFKILFDSLSKIKLNKDMYNKFRSLIFRKMLNSFIWHLILFKFVRREEYSEFLACVKKEDSDLYGEFMRHPYTIFFRIFGGSRHALRLVSCINPSVKTIAEYKI